MTNVWRLGRAVTSIAAVLAVTGCALALDPHIKAEVAEVIPEPMTGRNFTEAGMAALTRGDYYGAETNALAALRRDPKDGHALLVAGMANQGVGRYDLARQYYQAVISNNLQGTLMLPGEDGSLMSRSIGDVAKANLALVDRISGRSVPRDISQSGKGAGSGMFVQPMMSADPLPALPPTGAQAVQAPGKVTEAEANVSGRFRILKRLLDEGLITPAEYSVRRRANLGALLPYTHDNPAQGLERPIPDDDAVVERLQAMAVALENRGMSAAEHAAERTVILDALLPSKPKRIDLPVLPPKDMIAAAAAIGRLERLQIAGLISEDEVKTERAAIEKAYEKYLSTAKVDGTSTGLSHGIPKPLAKPAAKVDSRVSGWGVHLSSLKTEAGAKTSWETIRAKFPEQLGGLDAHFSKVTLKGKGVRWRVIAGNFSSQEQAETLCKALKLHRQFCDAMALGS